MHLRRRRLCHQPLLSRSHRFFAYPTHRPVPRHPQRRAAALLCGDGRDVVLHCPLSLCHLIPRIRIRFPCGFLVVCKIGSFSHSLFVVGEERAVQNLRSLEKLVTGRG